MRLLIEKYKMSIFVVLNLLLTIGMNLGHPVTPTLLKSLDLPPHVFGLSFAAMCLTNFIFALVWSNVANGMKKTRILMISSIGYAIAQLLFGYALNRYSIYFARLLSGIFAGGFQVGLMSYVVNEAPEDRQSHYITISSIIVSVGAALGFFIGGYLGDVSVRLTFVIQAVFQIILGILFYLILGSHENIEEKMEWSMIRNSNPLKVLQSSRHLMKDVVLILLIVTFTSSVGTTLFDQSFNYYIKDIFNFVPSQNGIIKAITGLFAVVLNVILIRRRNRKKQGVELGLLKTVFIAMGSLAIIVSFSQTSKPFVGFALAWFGMYTVMIPILQNSVISNKHSVEEGNQLAGLYNSLLMLGKIFGALLTSLIYTISPSSTFMFAGVIFILSFIILLKPEKRMK